jgi:hypothetical protein
MMATEATFEPPVDASASSFAKLVSFFWRFPDALSVSLLFLISPSAPQAVNPLCFFSCDFCINDMRQDY